jgi:protein arginine N-methyltransferase 1
MGYFLLYESMFDSVLYAKEKWLKPDGLLFPDKAKMYIAALDDEAYYKKKTVQMT